MPNEEFLKKITGDFADELGDSGYRTAATLLVNLVMVKGIDSLMAYTTDTADETKWWQFGSRRRKRNERLKQIKNMKIITNILSQYNLAGEAIVSFTLAVVLEFFPMPKIAPDFRKRLAYNLRVRTYEKAEEAGVRMFPFMSNYLAVAQRSIDELASMGLIDLNSGVASPPGDSETAGDRYDTH